MSAPGPSSSISTNQDFWEAFRITGDEVEGYQSVAEMSRAADAVVVGRFTSLDSNRQVQGDASEDVVTYAAAGLEIVRLLAGELEEEAVPLEFLVSAPELTAGEIERLEAALPRGDTVVFLRAKRGAGESGLYRTVNSLGLWASSDRSALDTPLAEGPPSESVFADEIAGLSSVAEMAEYVSSQVSATPNV